MEFTADFAVKIRRVAMDHDERKNSWSLAIA